MRPLLLAACALVLLVPSSNALEASRRIDDTRGDTWHAGNTVTITYYNICTGWIWAHYGFLPRTQLGVVVESPSAVSVLTASWHYIVSGVPAGYGFTGSIGASVVDAAACPAGVPLAWQVCLPITGWNLYSWSVVVPERFAIHMTTGPGYGTPLAMALDHPAPRGGGPPACGTCYPTTRVNHSFRWGTVALPLCPGEVVLHDGWCDAQLLWDFDLAVVDSVEPASWGRIKALFR